MIRYCKRWPYLSHHHHRTDNNKKRNHLSPLLFCFTTRSEFDDRHEKKKFFFSTSRSLLCFIFVNHHRWTDFIYTAVLRRRNKLDTTRFLRLTLQSPFTCRVLYFFLRWKLIAQIIRQSRSLLILSLSLCRALSSLLRRENSDCIAAEKLLNVKLRNVQKNC